MIWGLGRRAHDTPRRLRENLRLSPNEERYLLAETMTNQVYAVPSGVRILGPMDMYGLEEAIQATCDRHEARRTGYERSADGSFSKYIEDRATVRLKKISMPGASDAELREAIRAHAFQPGRFTPEDLHRYILISMGENDHVFGFALHHATSDGVTFRAFVMEVAARLLGFPIGDSTTQYSDFWDFDWTESDGYRAAEAFWAGKLEGLGEVGAWPEDRVADKADQSRLGVSVSLSAEAVAVTRVAAEQIGVTHFSFFYAVYLVLLARMTGQDTVCTTFQSAGRRGKTGAEGAHGVFSNALVLATKVDEAESIASLAARLRVEVREAISHEIFPYHHVIRKTGLHPRYAINWFPEVANVAFAGIELIPLSFDENQDDDDLNFRFVTLGDEARVVIYYKATAFGQDRVRAMADQLVGLAAALAKDINAPVGSVASVDLAPPDVLPDPAAPLPAGGADLIHTQFLHWAAETPHALAIAHGDRSWTYAELEARSAGFAAHLGQMGVAPGGRVAILADRGPELVWAVIGAARLGAVFTILDSSYPEARISALLDICAPAALVHTGGALVAKTAALLGGMRGTPVVDAADVTDAPPVALDQARPEAAAYYLFTSGSTGRPKCVAASHQPLTHFVAWQAKTFGLGASDRFTMLSGLSHDPLLRDIFTPLSLGAAVLIPDQATVVEPGALALWLRKTRATVAHLTPQVGHILAAGAARAKSLPDLRQVFWGGDVLRPTTAAEVAQLAPAAAQTNFYGCTETPQAAGYFLVDGDPTWKAVPVGFGTGDTQLLVVDAARCPVGIGEVGEIAVRSNYLSLGYVEAGRVLTPDDRGRDTEGLANIYYTGDRGLYLPSGAVLWLGRADDEIKVRGHRVDLSEVTAALQAYPGVASAVALAAGEGDGQRIAAFLVPGRGPPVREAELRVLLAARLPSFMTPETITIVERLPRLPNGKLDRQALLALGEVAALAPRPSGRTTATERALIEAWSSVLGARVITRDSSFASLGGDSLSYVQAYLATEEAIGEAPVGWHLMSIADLAGRRTADKGAWSIVDTPILFRAASILLVVAGHFSLLKYGGGATGLLMIISGFMLGNLALQQAFNERDAKPVLRSLWSIFVPTAGLSLLIFLARLPGAPPDPYIYLLTADFQDYSRLIPLNKGSDMYLWYVHCLLHILVLLYLSVLGLKVAKGFGVGRRPFLLGLFGLGCLGRFVLPGFLDDRFFGGHSDPFAMVNFLPTTHLATVLLGALIAGAATRREKLGLSLLILAYGGLSAWFYGPGSGAFILVGALVLLGLPRVRLPRLVSPLVFSLAGASLWIYLSHMVLWDLFERLGLPRTSVVTLILAVGSGVGFWVLWSKAIGLANRHLRKPLALQPDAAV